MKINSDSVIGIPFLMRQAFQGECLKPIASELLQRIELEPCDANAMMDLSTIFQIHGLPDVAAEFQSNALALRQYYRLQETNKQGALRILAIMGPGVIMDNMPIEFLVEHLPVQLESLYLGKGLNVPESIPEHDVAIMAICESDANQDLLEQLENVAQFWPRPMINHPSRIRRLSREKLSHDLDGIANAVTVPSIRFSRKQLMSPMTLRYLELHQEGADSGWIVRPVGSHAGHGLERIERLDEFVPYLERNEGDEFFVAKFIDYRSLDGWFRKYRIVMIQGECFPVHMAISQNWMVHYLNADMLQNERNRREEAEFMRNFSNGFLKQHQASLSQVNRRLGLDYVVLDCAETRAGELLIFEADNGAVVHTMDPVDIFPYKPIAMQEIFEAFHQLLNRFATQSRLSLRESA